MRARVVRTVRRPVEEVAAFINDPAEVLPVITGVGRFRHVDGDDWDVFMPIGTLQVGGMVRVDRSDPHALSWRTERGMDHSFRLDAAPEDGDPEVSLIRFDIEYRLPGLLVAKIGEVLARGVAVRHLEAAAEAIRHRLEWGE